MARTKRIFISDVHMNVDDYYGDISWYNGQSHRSRFLAFLEKHVLKKQHQIKDLVILGDLFDNWVCPPEDEPPTWNRLFTDNPEELDLLAGIAQTGVNVLYSHGNHDYDLPGRMLMDRVPGLRCINAYKGAGRVHAEHGHMHTLFNRPDFLNDPAFGRPIGYFITRLASCGEGSLTEIHQYLDDILRAAFTSETIFGAILEGLAERAGGVGEVQMPDGQDISVKDLKGRYESLGAQHGIGIWDLGMEAFHDGNLEGVGDRLCSTMGFNVCLFGHTHHAKIDKDWLFVEDRIYANCGTWCSDYAHFVTIDKRPIKSGLQVGLSQVDSKGEVIAYDYETL